MNIVTKDFPVTVTETGESATGGFEVILSAPTLDRDKEVVDPKAFEPLPAHISFDTDHSMTCDSVVGSGTPYYAADGTLRVKGTFCGDDRSQVIRQKVADGHIRTTSVTMLDAERETDEKDVVHIKRAELLNGTFTPVPSNREAVVLSAKSILAHEIAAKQGARNSAADLKLIQQMHDLAVQLGALCDPDNDSDTAGDDTDMDQMSVDDAETKAVSDKPWSQFSASDYTDEQYRRACLITGPTKSDCKLPVREPDGTLNRNGVHAAAAVLAGGRGGANLSPEDRRRAARALIRLYSQLGEDPPDSLTQAAKSITSAVGDDTGREQETDQNADAEGVTKSAVEAAVEAADAAADNAAASAAETAAETADEKSTLMARLAGHEHALAL